MQSAAGPNMDGAQVDRLDVIRVWRRAIDASSDGATESSADEEVVDAEVVEGEDR